MERALVVLLLATECALSSNDRDHYKHLGFITSDREQFMDINCEYPGDDANRTEYFFERRRVLEFRWDFYVRKNHMYIYTHRYNQGEYACVTFRNNGRVNYTAIYFHLSAYSHLPHAINVRAQSTSANVTFRARQPSGFFSFLWLVQCKICKDLRAVNYDNESDIVEPHSHSPAAISMEGIHRRLPEPGSVIKVLGYKATFKGLKPNTYYKLMAMDGGSKTQRELLHIFKTFRKPTSVSVESVTIASTPSSMLVYFKLNSSAYSDYFEEPVLGYIASVYSGRGELLQQINTTKQKFYISRSPEINAISIDNLEPSTNYMMQFHSYDTLQRRGPPSRWFYGTTTRAEGVIVDELTVKSVTNREIEIEWEGKVSEYTVSLTRTDPAPRIVKLPTTSVTQKHYKFTGLQPSAAYTISVSSTGGTFVPFDVSITTTTTNEIKAAEEVRADISRLEAELKDMEPKYNEKWQFLESIMQELHKNDASFNETSTEMVKMVSELKSRKARIRRMFRSPRNIRRTIIFMEIYMASVLLLAILTRVASRASTTARHASQKQSSMKSVKMFG